MIIIIRNSALLVTNNLALCKSGKLEIIQRSSIKLKLDNKYLQCEYTKQYELLQKNMDGNHFKEVDNKFS